MSVKSLKTGTRSISLLAGNTPEHHVLIAEVTVGAGGTANITFDNIPSTYQHLQLRGIARTARASAVDSMRIKVNTDTGSNYSYHYVLGDGSTASSGAATSQSAMWDDAVGDTATASVFCAYIIDILDYASTSKNKTTRHLTGIDRNGAGNVELVSNLWMNSSTAINALTLYSNSSSNWKQHSTFQLYGVK